MRKIAAHYIFPVSRPPVRNAILTLGDSGEVLDLSAADSALQEREGVEFYSGVLAPGFVNAHCHLELSHLEGATPQGAGLAGFISALAAHRNAFTGEQALRAIALADARMYATGTVAVGDISNGSISFEVKERSPIFYHTFVERFGLRREDVVRGVQSAKALAAEAARRGLSASLTPHAPYSTLPELYAALAESSRWSVHNQESSDENLLFREGRGALHALFAAMGLPPIPPTGKSSIYHTLQHAREAQRLLLVHNTYTSAADYEAAAVRCKSISWVLCPASNMYIERALPPLQMLRSKGAAIALGADSLASNASLNLLDELKLLAAHFPHIPLSEMLRWATLGGAEALGVAHTFGTFEPGKRPGVTLLSKLDLDKLSLTPETESRLLTKKNAYIC